LYEKFFNFIVKDTFYGSMKTIPVGQASQWIGGIAIAGLGIFLALTNPSPATYHRYAAKTISLFVMRDLCESPSQHPKILESYATEGCQAIASQGEGVVLSFIENNTDYQNFILFSLYTTELPMRSLRVLGIFNRFFIVS
jgi:Domain of unknown function (DUF4359)